MNNSKKILFYAYGNPGRNDDGLANMFVKKLKDWLVDEKIQNIETDSNYQLNIEDAFDISGKDIVIFVDASEEAIEDFYLSEVSPSDSKVEFSMHSVSASFVLDLCQKIYKKYPETYMLHIKGYEWNFVEEISQKAMENLNKALEFIKTNIQKPENLKNLTSKI